MRLSTLILHICVLHLFNCSTAKVIEDSVNIIVGWEELSTIVSTVSYNKLYINQIVINKGEFTSNQSIHKYNDWLRDEYFAEKFVIEIGK